MAAFKFANYGPNSVDKRFTNVTLWKFLPLTKKCFLEIINSVVFFVPTFASKNVHMAKSSGFASVERLSHYLVEMK